MKKLLFALSASLVLLASLSVSAGETRCAIQADAIKQRPPQNAADIVHHFWKTGRDSRSDEHLKTLYLFFKNGDLAVIEHKFCSMYNFEIAYFRSEQADGLDRSGLAKIIGGLYENYVSKKAKFKRPLPDIISGALKEKGFDGNKNLSAGLAEGEAEYPNERVEYSVGFTSLSPGSSIYSSVTTFYMGIGGAD